jgi:hypothetical protein
MKTIIHIFIFIFVTSCLDLEKKSSKNSDNDRGPLKVSKYLQKPHEISPKNWKEKVSRTIFSNQTTGFIFAGEICELVDKAFAILPVEIIYPSAKEYKTGIYYDALVPLDRKNCQDTDYAYMDINESFEFKNISITINRLTKSSIKPKLNLFIQLEPHDY